MINRFAKCFTVLSAIFFAMFGFNPVNAQVSSTVDMVGVISTSDTTPFWIHSNRNGLITQHGSHLFTRVQSHGHYSLFGPVEIKYGADLLARPGEASTLSFNQAYVRFETYGMYLSGGRFHNSSPIHDRDLGMGSLGISGNAVPIPQIRAGLIDWTDLPFTRGFIQLKGHIAHGWLGSRRYTEDLFLHEKVGHARFGGDFPLNFYGGLAHYVKWGGNNHPEYGDIPKGIWEYSRAFFALNGGEDSPGSFRNYMYGDHLGAWDFGFFLEFNDVDITVYRQFPIETKDNLKLKSYMDALTGISIQLSDNINLPITRFVYEYLYTKYQDGPRRPNDNPDSSLERDPYRGNENYYNHGVYRSGWVYNTRTIGNPLFIPSEQNLGVLNNRIIAHHVGFESQFNRTTLTGKATWSRNFGKRWDNRIPDLGETEIFDPYQDQWSFQLGIQHPIIWNARNFFLIGEVAYDYGGLVGNQFGMLTGVRWNI